MLEHFKFNHDEDDIIVAMGFDKRSYRLAKMTVQYELLAPAILAMGEDSFGNYKTGKSIVLEAALKRVEGNKEAEILVMYAFTATYQSLADNMRRYNKLMKNKEDGDIMAELRGGIEAESLGEAFKRIELLLSIKPLSVAIDFLKEVNCNYQKFIAFTVDDVAYSDAINGHTSPVPEEDDETPTDKYDDVDEMIRNAFKNSDEEQL